MLTIRNEQMAVLRRHYFDSFVERMLVHLRAAHPSRTVRMSTTELSDFVRAGVRKAKSYRVRSEDNLETFLDFAMIYGLDCFELPGFEWARRVLESSLGQAAKMNRLSEYMIFSRHE